MGSCFGKTVQEVRVHELAFMGICTEGAYGHPQVIDKIFEKAVEAGKADEIFEAKDEDGDTAFHKAALHGNPTCLQWIINKWQEVGRELDIDAPDHNGYSALYLVCFKGYLGAEGIASRTPEVKMKRKECIQILLNCKADVNYKTPKLRMTPLHWAAYQGDEDIVEMLLQHEAIPSPTIMGNTPVDIAGFTKQTDVVLIFCRHLEQQMIDEKAKQMGGISQDEESGIGQPVARRGNSVKIAPMGSMQGSLLRKDYEKEFELNAAGDKTLIKCVKVQRQELDYEESIQMRVFYWAAHYGFDRYVRLMILGKRWSPFIKSFRKRSVISGAVWGSRVETVRMILGEYEYTNVSRQNFIDLATTIFSKDDTDNNCLHYCYMIDLPEVRQILRDNGLFSDRSQRLNRRGQLPTQLRHFIKAEDSNEETEDEDMYAAQEAEMVNKTPDLMIQGSSLKVQKQQANEDNVQQIEELLAGEEDFDLKDKSDNFRLKFNKELTRKQKLAHYKTPDYCIVTRADTLKLLRLELDSLVSRGGVYYSIFDKIEEPEDFDKVHRGSDTMMIVLYFDDSVIDLMGEILNVECRLSKYDCQLPFKCFAADMFDQFNSRQHQAIITETLDQELDMDYMRKSGVILDHFPVHMPERSLIYPSWTSYKWRLSFGMIYRGFIQNMQPLNFIKDYYGEKFGFYFAWLIHYTGWLIPVAIIGTIFGIVMIVEGVQDEKSFDHYLASPISILYGITIMLWVTLFHESWKRKQNYIGNEWLVRGFQDATTERQDFKHETTIDPDTEHEWKIAVKDAYKTQLAVGVPVSLAFMGVVIGAQALLQYANYMLGQENDSEDQKVPIYWKYVPAVINSVLIIIFGKLYVKLSKYLVVNENHRYVSSFENSMINKIYMFQFVNTYIGNFVAILYNQNFASLTTNLAIVMLFKQLIVNSIEYFQEKYSVGKKIAKVEELFAQKIADAEASPDRVVEADLKMHCEIEKQLMMKPAASTLVFYYNEAVIQLGFIAFFATAFPFAPLFSFFTNLLEIKIKLNHIAEYGRRNFAQCTSGIGNWSSIMSFVSYFAIPINTIILLVCRFPTVQVGATQDLDALTEDEESVLVQYLHKKDAAFWNRANIVLLAILVEHLIIALKVVISLIIPDVPHKVREDEFRRMKIEESVQKEILEVKFKGNHMSFQDMADKLAKDAAELSKAEAEEDLAEEDMGSQEQGDLQKAFERRKKAQEKKAQLMKQMAEARQKAMINQRRKNQKADLDKRRRKKEEKKRRKAEKEKKNKGKKLSNHEDSHRQNENETADHLRGQPTAVLSVQENLEELESDRKAKKDKKKKDKKSKRSNDGSEDSLEASLQHLA